MTAISRRATAPYRAFVELGGRLSRDTLLYAVGTMLTLPVGLVMTGILTRHLPIAQFGQLAVLFAFAGVLTIGLNMVFLQGPLLLVFLHSEDGSLASPETAELAARQQRPIMLTTGLVATGAIALVAVAVVVVVAGPLATLLTGSRSDSDAVVLAGVSAACGSLWRYVTNVTRFEKRAVSFASWAAVRPVVALAVTVALIASGLGLRAALIGTAAGSLVSGAGALFVSRRSYAARVSVALGRRAARTGLPWVAVVLGLYFAHSADLLLLRATASDAQLGIYRIADSLSQVVSYGVSAFHLAQVPLDATLMSQAAYDEYSRDRVMAGYVLAYVIGAALITLLMIALGATVISVLAPGYGAAVPYVPVTAMAYIAYGFLLTVFRAGDFFKRRVRAYGWTAGSAGGLVIVLALIGGRVVGVAGVPIGAAIGCAVPSVVLLTVGAIRRHPLPLDYPRVLGALALGLACWAPGAILSAGGHAHTPAAIGARAGAVLAYVAALAAFGIIPRSQLRQIGSLIGSVAPRRSERRELLAGVAALGDREREALLAIVRDGADSATVAARLGHSEVDVRRLVVSALRTLAGGSGEFALDDRLGYYLVSGDPPADLDAAMRDFRRSGANMVEFRVLERIFGRLKRLPRRAFTQAVLDQHAPSTRARGQLLDALAAAGWEIPAAAATLGVGVDELRSRALTELRALAGWPASAPHEQLIARFLLEPGTVEPRQLWAAGVDPVELHRLELALVAARGQQARRRVAGSIA